MVDLALELRVMHACEKGAVGVYRGHKCVARYFYRNRLPLLDSMRFHEREHSQIFAEQLAQRGFRQCYLASLWFWGGLFYGVLVGLLGIKAIGTSTFVIETIVDHEFDLVLSKLGDYPELFRLVTGVQMEEREHRAQGEVFSAGRLSEGSLVKALATSAAYAAKFLAERF